jgi:hypothetical protein
VERRRAALERFINRTAQHPSFKADPDFREFLELDADLPKSSQVTRAFFILFVYFKKWWTSFLIIDSFISYQKEQ